MKTESLVMIIVLIVVVVGVSFLYTHSYSQSPSPVTNPSAGKPESVNSTPLEEVSDRAEPTVQETLLIGGWKAENDNGFRDAIDFSVNQQTEEQVFIAYYNRQPADQGTWKLEGDVLILYSSTYWKYTSLTVTNNVLMMTNDDGDVEVYQRN